MCVSDGFSPCWKTMSVISVSRRSVSKAGGEETDEKKLLILRVVARLVTRSRGEFI